MSFNETFFNTFVEPGAAPNLSAPNGNSVNFYLLTNAGARAPVLPATADVGARVQVQNGQNPGGPIVVTVAGGGSINFGLQTIITAAAGMVEFVFANGQWWAR